METAQSQAEPSKSETEQPIKCPRHPGTTAELFCSECNEIACTRCPRSGNKHFKHPLIGLDDGDELVRRQLQQVQSVVKRSLNAVQHHKRKIRRCQKCVTGRADGIVEQINNRINKIVDDLQQVSMVLTIAVQQRGQQQHRTMSSRGSMRLRFHTSRCGAQLMELTKNLLARKTVVQLKSDVQLAERASDYISELSQLTEWQSTEVGKLVDDKWLKKLEAVSDFVERLRASADELVVQCGTRKCASVERQPKLHARTRSLKKQTVAVQLGKDSAAKLNAAVEDELKKTKADCDMLKRQLIDRQSALDLSEAQRSSLEEQLEELKWERDVLVGDKQCAEEDMNKMIEEKVAFEDREKKRQSELQEEVDILREEVTSLTNQLSESHALVQTLVEENASMSSRPAMLFPPLLSNSGNQSGLRSANRSFSRESGARAARGDDVVHPGIRCDGCQVSPIRGIRYKCQVCPIFNFCTSCKSSQSHGHAMLAFEYPEECNLI